MSQHHKKLNKRMWAHCRFLAFTRDNFRCVKCSRSGRLEGHHKVSLNDGGSPYDPANVLTLCREHHIETALDPMRREWARYLKHTYKQLGA